LVHCVADVLIGVALMADESTEALSIASRTIKLGTTLFMG